jgi:diguanylate cyclase (GGDEF)-like protein
MLFKKHMQLLLKSMVIASGFIISFFIFYFNYFHFVEDITFTLLYLVPIVIVVWYSSFFAGLFLSIFSIVEWGIVKTHQQGIRYDNVIFLLNLSAKFMIFLFIIILLRKLKTAYEKEKKISRIDMLTGALNRKGIFEIIEAEIQSSKNNNFPITLAYIDIDNFKMINDRLGHHVGDKLLKLITDIVTFHIRGSDYFARIGGDEFIILFPNTGKDASHTLIDKIRHLFSEAAEKEGWRVSLSIGIGVFKGKAIDREKMLMKTDSLMYKVKKGQKNGVLFRTYSS